MTAAKKSKAYDALEVISISIYVNDRLTHKEGGALYRMLWKFFENQCIPPVGIQLDYEPDVVLEKNE